MSTPTLETLAVVSIELSFTDGNETTHSTRLSGTVALDGDSGDLVLLDPRAGASLKLGTKLHPDLASTKTADEGCVFIDAVGLFEGLPEALAGMGVITDTVGRTVSGMWGNTIHEVRLRSES